MSAQPVDENLSASFDGEVAHADQVTDKSDQKGSSAGQEILDDYKKLSDALQSLPPHRLDEQFQHDVLSSIEQQRSVVQPRQQQARGRAGIFCGITALLLLMILFRPWSIDTISPEAPFVVSPQPQTIIAQNELPTETDETETEELAQKNTLSHHPFPSFFEGNGLPGWKRELALAERGKMGRTLMGSIAEVDLLQVGNARRFIATARRNQTASNVVVAKLTVKDCKAGLHAFQQLLEKNAIAPQPQAMIPTFRARNSNAHLLAARNAEMHDAKTGDAEIGAPLISMAARKKGITRSRKSSDSKIGDSASGNFAGKSRANFKESMKTVAKKKGMKKQESKPFVAVLVEASPQQLESTVSALRNNTEFRSLRMARSIPLHRFDANSRQQLRSINQSAIPFSGQRPQKRLLETTLRESKNFPKDKGKQRSHQKNVSKPAVKSAPQKGTIILEQTEPFSTQQQIRSHYRQISRQLQLSLPAEFLEKEARLPRRSSPAHAAVPSQLSDEPVESDDLQLHLSRDHLFDNYALGNYAFQKFLHYRGDHRAIVANEEMTLRNAWNFQDALSLPPSALSMFDFGNEILQHREKLRQQQPLRILFVFENCAAQKSGAKKSAVKKSAVKKATEAKRGADQ